MKIIDRYLLREVAKPIIIFFCSLTAIFAAYSASDFLGDAAQGLIRVDTITTLVFLKSVIAMEVLLPIATFLTTVIVLSRLGSTYEITAMAFCGYSRLRIFKTLTVLFLIIAGITAYLSIWARPKVYGEIYRLTAEAAQRINLEDVQEGVFLQTDKGKTVLHVDRRGADDGPLAPRRTFMFLDDRGGRRLVLMARSIKQVDDLETGAMDIILRDLEGWQLEGPADSMTIATEEITIPFDPGGTKKPRRRRKATPTVELGRSSNSEDISEYQWRISRPFSTFILGLIAVGIANFVPRRDRYLRLLLAVVVYAVYFNLQAMARTWVERGQVPEMPGIFWLDAAIAGLIAFLFVRSRLRQSRTT